MPDLEIDADPEDQHQSYILSGPINTMNEGGAIPVLYGAPIVGSTVISAGLEIEQIAIEADEETTPKDDDSDPLFTGADPNDPNQSGGGPGGWGANSCNVLQTECPIFPLTEGYEPLKRRRNLSA